MATNIDKSPVTPQQYEVLHGGGAEAAEIAKQRLSRRRFLRRSMLAVWGISAVASVAGALEMLYPNVKGTFGGVLTVGKKSDFKAALPKQFQEGIAGVYHRPVARTYVTHFAADTQFLQSGVVLQEELKAQWWVKDSDGTYWLALYQRCVHLGCTVPFRDDCDSFKCPCHGSHYNVDGEYLDGPAPRSLDRFKMYFVDEDVVVDTGTLNYPLHPVPHPDATTRLLPVPTIACSAA
jgi:cytochrome b6-f complex iron-sulfur subunit